MTRGRALGPGRLFRRGRRYVLDFRDSTGQRRHWVVGDDKHTAERKRAEIIRRRDLEVDGLGSLAGQDMQLAEVVEQYVSDLAARASARHMDNVVGRLARTLDALGPMRVRDLRAAHVLRLRSEALAAGAANRTANLVVETLKSALNWAVDTGLVAENPIRRVKKLPEGRGHQRRNRRALSDAEIARYLDAIDADDRNAYARGAVRGFLRIPQRPLFVAMLDTGARYGELRQATWGDVDLSGGVLLLRAETTKSRKQRAIPLSDLLREELKRLRVAQQRALGRIPTIADRVFLSPKGTRLQVATTNTMRIHVRALERAGLAKTDEHGRTLDVHAMRHSFASRLARNGVSLVQSQKLLGHSDPKLTAQVYSHLDVEDLRGAIDSLNNPGPTRSITKETRTP